MIELTYWQFALLGFFAFIGLMASIFAVWLVTSKLSNNADKQSESEMFNK